MVGKCTQTINVVQLMAALIAEWNNIPMRRMTTLTNSMHRESGQTSRHEDDMIGIKFKQQTIGGSSHSA